MPNPTPIYVVKYNGTNLLGYAQDEDIPLAMRLSAVQIIGKDGGNLLQMGADFRSFKIGMRILSRLSNNSTGLAHLNDCKDQWRTNLSILSRPGGPSFGTPGLPLYVGESDRYILCEFESSSAPLVAGNSKAISYDLNFKGNPPWFLGTEVVTITAVSGDTTASVTVGPTRKTYPTIEIEAGITHIKLTLAGGKSITLQGPWPGPLFIYCATLQITCNGLNALQYLTSSPDFGMFQIGAGTFALAVTEVVGSGNVILSMAPRYER